MIPWNVIVTAVDGNETSAQELRARLLDAWREPPILNLITLPVADLEGLDLAKVDSVILLADREEDAAVVRSELVDLEESGVAMLTLLRDEAKPGSAFSFAGAMVERVESEAPRICALLRGLLHRQTEVRRLRRDLSVAYRFHGGLKGEIARMHEELQLAAIVQREFLPRAMPRLCGVEFAALWRPAHYVSGDIYDVSRLDDDHVCVFVADAVGHGVPAALMTMVIVRSLTTKIISESSYQLVEPAEVLHRLNHDLIRRQGGSTRFATAVYALVDCRGRTMRVAGAGHPPPLLFEDDGSTRELDTSGGLLGVFEDETYDQIEVELAAGDRLLVHSDGFEQAFPIDAADDHDRRIPNERYREEFAKLAREVTPREMVRTIGRRLDESQGSLHQIDDLTMVCMHAGPLPRATETETTQADAAQARAAQADAAQARLA